MIEIEVDESEIDGLGHANNVVYLKWMERVAWAHSISMGLDLEKYRELDRAMVSKRHEMEYFAPCFLGERLIAATWIISNDCKIKMERRYQIIRESDGVTLLKGLSQWVCVSYSTGKPRRMPEPFLVGYATTVKEPKENT